MEPTARRWGLLPADELECETTVTGDTKGPGRLGGRPWYPFDFRSSEGATPEGEAR
jgi:hypothetical protein